MENRRNSLLWHYGIQGTTQAGGTWGLGRREQGATVTGSGLISKIFPRFPLAQMPLWGGMGREVLIVMCGCTTTVSKEVRCFGQSE